MGKAEIKTAHGSPWQCAVLLAPGLANNKARTLFLNCGWEWAFNPCPPWVLFHDLRNCCGDFRKLPKQPVASRCTSTQALPQNASRTYLHPYNQSVSAITWDEDLDQNEDRRRYYVHHPVLVPHTNICWLPQRHGLSREAPHMPSSMWPQCPYVQSLPMDGWHGLWSRLCLPPWLRQLPWVRCPSRSNQQGCRPIKHP